MGFGLKVTGKYDNGNDDWLAHDGNKNEWAIAYHGVRANKLEQAVGNIFKGGFELGKNHYYEKYNNRFKPGTVVGKGIIALLLQMFWNIMRVFLKLKNKLMESISLWDL